MNKADRRQWLAGCLAALLALWTGAVRGGDPLCGPESLYVGLLGLGVEPGRYGSFLQAFGAVEPRGVSLGRLEETARSFGVETLLVATTLENLARRRAGGPFTCVAHVDGDHFVLIGDVEPTKVWIVDPPQAEHVASALFRTRWRGQALLLSQRLLAPEESLRASGPSWWLWGAAIIGVAPAAWGLLRTRMQS